MPLTLEGLELIDAIDRAGSFAAAAEALGKAPSTASYAIGRLEAELGVALFRRHGPRIEMTEAGRELLREGRLLLQAAGDLEGRVRRIASGWESRLRIAVDSVIPAELLGPHAKAFQAVADTTRLVVSEETLTGGWEALLDGRADLVLASGDGPAGGGYVARPVATLDFAFCVAPFHPLARATEPIQEADLRRHMAVSVADSARRLTTRTVGLLSGQPTLTAPSMRVKLRWQQDGLGVGHLPRIVCDGALADGRLVRRQVAQERAPDHLALAWRERDPGHALRWWIDRLQQPETIGGLLQAARLDYAALR